MTPTPATPGGLDLAALDWVIDLADNGSGLMAEDEGMIHRAKELVARLRSQVSGGEGAPADLRERLAALCHEQWSGWMKYLFEKCESIQHPEGEDGETATVIPVQYLFRWGRQLQTPYERLSEQERESDRKEADRFLALLPAPAVPDAMTWTREKPTVEGFYWCRNNQGPGGWIEEIYSRLGDLWTKDMTPVKDLPAYREWAGPLPEPREAPPAPASHLDVIGAVHIQREVNARLSKAAESLAAPVTPTLGKE